MSSKKNILFILADQLRHDFCGCYGADFLSTPNIDQLAADGVLYETVISPSPACVPARASIMTGRSALENRVTDNAKWLRPDHAQMGILTWPQQLATAGYHTAAIGKMHFYPWDISEGFQYRVIAEDKRHIDIQDDYTMYLKKRGYNRLHANVHDGFFEHKGAIISKIPEEHQIDRYVCNETCDYLDTLDGTKPFALMVGFPGPHCPYDPTQEVMDQMKLAPMIPSVPCTPESEHFRPTSVFENGLSWNGVDLTVFTEAQKEKIRLHYAALVQGIDEHVGTIIAKLKTLGIYDDTIILFSSDHGDYLGDFGMLGKGLFYESSCRIPLIVRHPEQEAMVVSHPVSLTDTYQTILNFADFEVEDTDDSTVLAPFGKSLERSPIFGSIQNSWMLRNDCYQYTISANGLEEFYDMCNDPTQQQNLIREQPFPAAALEMRSELMKRVFTATHNGNSDNIAKVNNLNHSKGFDEFNYEGWQRPYPFAAPK
ncbi:MAG: sulfatase-like hydrolase/transferase [Lachnospiraceae bacterium]